MTQALGGGGTESAVAGGVPETTDSWFVTARFERQVRSTPRATALVHQNVRVSFAELNARANRLAYALTVRGAGPGHIVALALARRPEIVVALLAVLKTGAAYLPLDPDHPPARLRTMLDDAGPALLVTDTRVGAVLSAPGIDRLVLDDPTVVAELATSSDADPLGRRGDRGPTRTSVAYVIYTSGSSGPPKGVAVRHSGLANLFENHRRGIFASAVARANGRAVLRAAQTASFSFDVSWDHLLWMVAGHELHIIDDDVRADPVSCVEYVARHRIDYVGTTPTYLGQLLSAGLLEGTWCPGTIAVGGEAIPEGLWNDLRAAPDLDAFSFYGTTECTVDSLMASIAESPRPSLGRPILNTRIYVLDDRLRRVPDGEVGELYVSGAGLAEGYLGNPELTAERFVECPFEPPGGRMYRTGDLVRANGAGELEFMGRADKQVKIRGFRIEPAEIEAHLSTHPDVQQATVIAQVDRSGGSRLVAYVVPVADRGSADDRQVSLSVDSLRRFTRQNLPAHMVPSAFVPIAAFPLTVNGKLDYGALPDPPARSTDPRAPHTPTQQALCPLFAEVLGVESMGIDDDLFDLGGNSLQAMRLATLIGSTLGERVSVRSVLQAPTVAGLAELIDAGVDLDPFDTVVSLRAGDSRPALFCLPPAGGIGWFYAGLVPYLESDQPVYALQAASLGRPLPASDEDLPGFEHMTSEYVAQIQAVQPHGPYHLLGWSLGGTFAHAVAVALQRRGEPVASLSILDARPLHPEQEPQPFDAELVGELLSDFADPSGTEEAPGDGGGPTAPTVDSVLSGLDPAELDKIMTLVAHDFTVRPSTPPGRFEGSLLFFRAMVDPWAGSDPEAQWRPWVTGPITVHALDCGHAEMAQPDPAARIGRILTERLRPPGPTSQT